MAFWNLPSVDPTRKFRFLMQSNGIESDQWIWAKSINKPSYEINTGEYQLGNHKFKYPGIATWNDITITIVDMFGQTSNLFENLKSMGYNDPSQGGGAGIHKSDGVSSFMNEFSILQLDADGGILETWELKGAFIKSVNYGDLNYSDDEIIEISMVVTYDYATFSDVSAQQRLGNLQATDASIAAATAADSPEGLDL